MSERVRAWIYLVATFILIGLLIAGVLSGDEVDSYLGLVAAAIGAGAGSLAVANTSINPPPGGGS